MVFRVISASIELLFQMHDLMINWDVLFRLTNSLQNHSVSDL